MFYERKEFTLKNGLTIAVKAPDKSEARELLDFVVSLAGQTPFLLGTPADFDKMTVEQEEEFIESYSSGNGYLLAVYVDGKIVGDCNIDFKTHEKDRHRCSVGIGIDEKYCGMGIGSLLFDEIIRLAGQTDGVEQIELGVCRGNIRAYNLYKKKGFTETGYTPRALKYKDGTYCDEIIMAKFLDTDE